MNHTDPMDEITGHDTDELVVLLDPEGRAIGTAPKRDVHHADTPLHLAFSCYVVGPDGRFLLTRRARTKRTWPGVWTNSCCGHPAPGESLEPAVRRRAVDELGLELGEVRVALPAFRYTATMADGTRENEVCPVVVATCDDLDAVSPDPTEVEEYCWVDWASLRADVIAGRADLSPWCLLQVPQLPADLREPATHVVEVALPPVLRAVR